MNLSSASIKERFVDRSKLSAMKERVSPTELFSSLIVLLSLAVAAATVVLAGWLAVGE